MNKEFSDFDKCLGNIEMEGDDWVFWECLSLGCSVWVVVPRCVWESL